MTASTDIKYFTFENLNAPQLQNAYGSMISVLDACLVTGLQLPQVAGITFTDGIATISFNTAHKLKQYQVIEISGANVAELNTQHRLLSVTSTTATFKTSVTSAGGTFAARLPALGWEKAFSSSNANGGGKAAYRSKNLLLPSRPFLRVVDELDPAYTATYAKYAKVGIVEDMSDIDTMLGVQAPYDNTAVNKNWVGSNTGTSAINGWAKWYYAGGSSLASVADSVNVATGDRSWVLIGCGDWFYLLPATLATVDMALIYGFGAFSSLLNNDASANFLGCTYNYTTANDAYYKGLFTGLGGISGNSKCLIQRKYTQEATPTESRQVSLSPNNSFVATGQSDIVGSKNLANKVIFAPVFFNEAVLRGELPSLRWLYQIQPYSNRQTFEAGGHGFISVHSAGYTSSPGAVVFDLGEL